MSSIIKILRNGLWGALLATAAPALPSDLDQAPRTVLTVISASGKQTFSIWHAKTESQQRQGLMFVRDLPQDQGMLFVSETPRPWSMWMKNTYISLDMLFINQQGQVVGIFENTRPFSLTQLSLPMPVLAVLELRGGEVSRRGIHTGDRVLHEVFK